MPFYRITITLSSKTVKGIKELDNKDIDDVWLIFKASAEQAYDRQNILDFEVVMVSKHSDDYRNWKLKSNK